MEPQELAKNDETSGFSRRRISILKAPRKSTAFPDPEQQTNLEECAKPVEKRPSRRVSFAPANDVLLFSKDVKNASPTRSPLQELMIATGATTQNRFPGAEDGSQAMETLLNAPLHGLQQQDKVRFDTVEGFGEKTVVFSSDDAFMDMTHSQTINFASYGEFLADDALPSGGEKMVMFAADDASMDMTLSHTVNLMNGTVSLPRHMDLNVQKRNVPSTLPSFDPGFEDFLASLSKSGGPSSSAAVESTCSLAHIKEKKADVDKENRLPASVPSVMEKSLNASRKTGQASYESVLCPDDNVSMNLTEVQTGRILGFTGTDDPFQCLFPTEDMYVHTDRRVSQMTAMTKTSSDPKAVATTDTRVQKILIEDGKGKMSDAASLKNHSLNASHQRHKANFFAREEKTIMFSADDEFMDMTQSHTINISRGSLAPQKASADGLDSGFKNSLSGLSKPTGLSMNPMIKRAVPSTAPSFKETSNTNNRFSHHKTPRADVGKANRLVDTSRSCSSARSAVSPEKDMGMDITESQTGRIIEMADSDDPFNFLFPTQDMYSQSESLKKAELTSGQKNSEARRSSHNNNNNNTGVETSLKHSLKTKQQRLQFDADNVYNHKAADDTCMDVTRSHTVHIGSDLNMPSNQNFLPCKDKTVMFNVHDAGMDMTQCLTVNIANSLGLDPVLPPAKDRTIRFDVHDAGMDMTNCLTVNIANSLGSDPVLSPKDKTMRFDVHNAGMDMTQCLTVNIANNLGPDSLNPSLKKQELDQALATSDKTMRFDVHDAGMDMTKCLTVNIANNLGSDSVLSPLNKQEVDPVLPPTKDKTVRFDVHDAGMDMTQCLTVNIANSLGSDTLNPPMKKRDVDPVLPPPKDKTIRFDVHDAGMDMTKCLTVNIANSLGSDPVLAPQKDKTMRFDVQDAGMDMTQCLTVNIANSLGSDTLNPPMKKRDVDPVLPPPKDKTIRFDVHDAGMDMTKCLTVNIANNLGSDPDLSPMKKREVCLSKGRSSSAHVWDPEFNSVLTEVKSVDLVGTKLTSTAAPSFHIGDSSTICPDDDVNMDMTEFQTDQIVGIAYTDVPSQCLLPTHDVYPLRGDLKKGEMTSQLQISEEPRSCAKVKIDAEDNYNKETAWSSRDDAATMGTHGPSVNISHKLDLFLPNQGLNFTFSHRNMDLSLPEKTTQRSKSMSARDLDSGFKNSLSRTSGSWANPLKRVTPALQGPLEGVGMQMQKLDEDALNVAQGFVPTDVEKSPNKTMTDCPEVDVSMDMTEGHTGHVFGHTHADDVSLSLAQGPDPSCDLEKQTNATSQQSSEAVESCNFPECIDSNEMTKKESKARNEPTSSSSQEMKGLPPAAVDQVADALYSRRSRRMSLADLQSKARRLSHIINSAPDTLTAESCITPLPQLDHDLDKTSENKSKIAVEPELEMALENPQDIAQGQGHNQAGEVSAATTPFNLKTKLMSRISMGGFKPKLPQRSSANNPKKVNSSVESTRTMAVNVTGQLRNLDNDVRDIFDEELGICEDMSEILDVRSPQKTADKERDFNIDELIEEDIFKEDIIGAVQGVKRPMHIDENNVAGQKRRKASTQSSHDATDMELQSHIVEGDGNTTAAPNTTTQTTDCSSSSHTASIRCEATFESTFKQSLFESQLEDYTCDAQKKLDNGSITVLEFFKLFNIDFVIHNPRQSILPGKLLSDTEHTPIDLLKDRHISRPKQMAYEMDVLNLTEKVEGLKVRMRDLDKPLKMVNKALWEEMRNSSEKELKSFGATLKVRNNFFRKMSKAKSHEMKEVLYSNLVQTNLEEQQRLRETIAQADEMIKSLDDCICELESELVTVEDKGLLDKPSLKSQQEEMKKLTQALADNEREMTELELQKQQNSSKLKRMRAETSNLENHVSVLHLINEWKFGEKKDNCTVYTFLHDTMQLQLVYEKSTEGACGGGDDDDDQSEGKITEINFKLQLDDEKSQCHARLVHTLVSQYIQSQPCWVEKYPSRRHVPELLHDVSLVVSRCRLLGEELRLLKMWGGLKLGILDISCSDTQVLIVFSSLKTCTKFEVIFSVSLINEHCVIQVESCKSMIGNTEIQQIKEIVASFSPARNVLTKIVKKIHEHLLR
ncbi:hypothetical protein JOB18_020445 [Solea senegalensis]|nr:uncharacterized protein knl1 [Solea senegalensis]KAG7508661.1 hypothetical protein JOB18_020445 [Solea senegalensis]